MYLTTPFVGGSGVLPFVARRSFAGVTPFVVGLSFDACGGTGGGGRRWARQRRCFAHPFSSLSVSSPYSSFNCALSRTACGSQEKCVFNDAFVGTRAENPLSPPDHVGKRDDRSHLLKFPGEQWIRNCE